MKRSYRCQGTGLKISDDLHKREFILKSLPQLALHFICPLVSKIKVS